MLLEGRFVDIASMTRGGGEKSFGELALRRGEGN